MPLAFDSLSHGKIAFGFFNIDTDMLLLEQYFLFGSDFCKHIVAMAEGVHESKYRTQWPVYIIEDRAKIGDLMGAIHGIRFTGFIGELYQRYPFPQKPEDFKQKTKGYLNQDVVRGMICGYAHQQQLSIEANQPATEIGIGEYRFSRKTFQELINYVWCGGYPGWQDDTRPDYVEAMKAKIENHRRGLFERIQFD
jgi:hypothetical protein